MLPVAEGGTACGATNASKAIRNAGFIGFDITLPPFVLVPMPTALQRHSQKCRRGPHRRRQNGDEDEIGFQTDLHLESHVNFRHEFEQRIDKTCFERAIAADLLVGFVFGIRAESGYAGRRSGRSPVLFVFVHRSESGLTCNSFDGTPEVPGHRSWRLLEYPHGVFLNMAG